MRDLIPRANDGHPVSVTTSRYGLVSHTPALSPDRNCSRPGSGRRTPQRPTGRKWPPTARTYTQPRSTDEFRMESPSIRTEFSTDRSPCMTSPFRVGVLALLRTDPEVAGSRAPHHRQRLYASPFRPARLTAWEAYPLPPLTDGRFEMGIDTGRPGIEEVTPRQGTARRAATDPAAGPDPRDRRLPVIGDTVAPHLAHPATNLAALRAADAMTVLPDDPTAAAEEPSDMGSRSASPTSSSAPSSPSSGRRLSASTPTMAISLRPVRTCTY